MTPSTTLALLAALYHYKDINEPERLGEDMGHDKPLAKTTQLTHLGQRKREDG